MTQLSRLLFSLLVALAAGSTCGAFRVKNLKVESRSTSRKAVIGPDMPGQVAPLGFFDPWGLSVGTNERIFKRWQESEIKHGRVAMMAVLGILVAENFHPFYGGSVGGPAISHFSQIDKIEKGFWLVPFLAIGSIEAISIATTWAPRKDTKGTVGWLKDNHTPGDLGFDPLGLSPEKKSKYSWNEIRTKELQNGRLAMLAVAGIVAQELVDGKTVLGHLVGPLVEI